MASVVKTDDVLGQNRLAVLPRLILIIPPLFEYVHKLFNHTGIRRTLLKVRIPVFIVLVLIWPWIVDREMLLPGLTVSLLGVAIQWWCFACLEKEKVLTIRGPYQLCRNPMYLGRYLLILGFIIAINNIPVILVFTVIYWFYMVNRVKREEPVLENIFGQPYRDYCRDVNRFLPGFRRVDGNFFFFDWEIMLSNNGHWNLLSVVVGYAYIYAMIGFVVQ
ncbi:MAG: isoprenylcysteine carboxylmethyltransferase family protein [Pseudomonadota bacterium]